MPKKSFSDSLCKYIKDKKVCTELQNCVKYTILIFRVFWTNTDMSILSHLEMYNVHWSVTIRHMQIQKNHVHVPDCCTSFKTEHKKRMHYDASFKLKVVEMAKGANNCEAARKKKPQLPKMMTTKPKVHMTTWLQQKSGTNFLDWQMTKKTTSRDLNFKLIYRLYY